MNTPLDMHLKALEDATKRAFFHLLDDPEAQQRIGHIAKQVLLAALAAPTPPATLAEHMQPPTPTTPEPQAVLPEPEPEPEPEPSPPPDPLRQELETELALLALVRQTPWLASEWLQEDESEGQTLVRLIATAAQWNQVQELAEKLIKLCKTEQRPAKPAEKRLLAGSVALHNRIWKGRQASLEKVKPGAAYDYKTHQRGNDRGETIAAEWLPGLRNAAGELVCLPLVRTE